MDVCRKTAEWVWKVMCIVNDSPSLMVLVEHIESTHLSELLASRANLSLTHHTKEDQADQEGCEFSMEREKEITTWRPRGKPKSAN